MLCIRGVFASARPTGKLSIRKDRTPSQISGFYHAAQRFSQIRRDWMPIVQSVLGDSEFALGIEHDEVCIVSSRNSPLARAAASQLGRCRGHPACQIEQRETSLARLSPHQRQRY